MCVRSIHNSAWNLVSSHCCELFSCVQSLSCVWLFAAPWTAACQASLSITNSRSLLKCMSIESVMPSNHLIFCRPLCVNIPQFIRASLVVQTVKNLPAVWETQVWALGWEDPLEKEMATHSSILAWRIPWTKRSLVGYSPWACKESDTTKWLTHTHHSLLICSIVDGLSDSSQCLAVINHAAMTVLVPGFWEIHVYIYV